GSCALLPRTPPPGLSTLSRPPRCSHHHALLKRAGGSCALLPRTSPPGLSTLSHPPRCSHDHSLLNRAGGELRAPPGPSLRVSRRSPGLGDAVIVIAFSRGAGSGDPPRRSGGRGRSR